ncbi:L-2-hydroxyglutarate dehydrogenase, mitochondrial isoform X2 [Asparagus officinalis]|uniref:L-2-hydroxyglutarate dehydrogenase, mitochondrial isoform X2 n=1 Tax=Asparagus officinalis TaxID=4686 RepID=UPI00098E71AC|nr:L-2-hydroxyglutarate dehydrogenase, mitochondrial isoform X2 [Asparagus officinalis]
MLRNTIRNCSSKIATAIKSSPRGFAATPTETADAVVVGAAGLAVARELALRGREVLVIESAGTFGTGTSSRNSEVIHAGIYYPAKSLKARFCVRGKELLYKYCCDRGIPHKQLGKLIVATSVAEIPKLENLMRFGIANGVEDLRMMEGSDAMRMEPELQCVKALLSPSTGIVDSHSFMLSLLGEAENCKATLSYNTTVVGGHIEGDRLHLHISESKELANNIVDSPVLPQLILIPRLVINSAGLSAVPLARSHLIYPMPEDGGIGVHVTIDLSGLVKFGPDVEWISGPDDISSFLNRFDYSVSSDRSARFYPEIRKYFRNLKDGCLEPGYSGIRAKLCGPKQPPQDFMIQGEDVHGVPGLINLFGIESPGLTSSLAIAEYIVSKL